MLGIYSLFRVNVKHDAKISNGYLVVVCIFVYYVTAITIDEVIGIGCILTRNIAHRIKSLGNYGIMQEE